METSAARAMATTAAGARAKAGAAARRARRSAILVAAWGALACAPTQHVIIQVEPDSASVYVDGKVVAQRPTRLELRSDQDHKLYFKSEGYRSELVVLRSVKDGRSHRLEPDLVEVDLAPLDATGGRSIEIERESHP